MIRTTNDVMRSLLFQTSLLARYWAESLHTTTYLLNLLPTKAISTPSPTSLFSAPLPPTPTYGSSVAPATRTPLPQLPISSPPPSPPPAPVGVFPGYSSEHKGYQCLNLNTNRLLITQHIVFDEASFPFASSGTPPGDLDSLFSSSPTVCPIAPPYPSSTAGTSEPDVTPRAALAPQPAPRAALALRFIEPPWCTSGDIRPPPRSPPAPGRQSAIPSSWFVTPAARSTHPMVTRRAARVTKLVDRLQLSAAAATSTLSPVPTFIRSALMDPH
jgi:hypothetical protein